MRPHGVDSVITLVNCQKTKLNGFHIDDMCLYTQITLGMVSCFECLITRSTFKNIHSKDLTSQVFNFQGASPFKISFYYNEISNITPIVFHMANCNGYFLQNNLSYVINAFTIIGGSLIINKVNVRNVTSPLQPIYKVILLEQTNIQIQAGIIENAEVERVIEVVNEFTDNAVVQVSYNRIENVTIVSEQGGAFKFKSYGLNLVFIENELNNITAMGQQAKGIIHWGVQNNGYTQVKDNILKNVHSAIGAIIYYQYSLPIFEQGSNSNNYTASIYGNPIASYPVRIAFISEEEYTNYHNGDRVPLTSPEMERNQLSFRSGDTLPKFYIALLDLRNYIYSPQNTGTISFTTPTSQSAQQKPIVSNAQSQWIKGTIAVENVTVIAKPGTDVDLEVISSNIFDLSKPDVIQTTLQYGRTDSLIHINVRTCQAGEAYLTTGECQSCLPHTYLFGNSAEVSICLSCPQFARCFGGQEIGPIPGFWRSDKYSLTFFSCLNSAACQGSFHPTYDSNNDLIYNPNGDCTQNYEGRLCSQCAKGYTRNTRFECAQCQNFWLNLVLNLFFGLMVIIILTLIIYCTVKSMSKPSSQFSVYLRIITNHLQLLMLVASFRFDWPSSVKTFFAVFQAVSDAPQSLFSVECLFEGTSGLPRFYLYLIIYCSLPVVGIATTIIYCKIKHYRAKKVFEKRCTATILVFIFFLHPSITSQILSLFNCFHIDGHNYLYQELSEECWSRGTLHFIFIIVLGAPGMIIWVLGIPLWTFMILHEKKKYLTNQDVREKYGFLYNGFKPRSFYWQAVSIFRKEIIAMIGVFLVQQGTLVQSYLLLLVLVLFILLTLQIQPYDRAKLNNLELYSFFTLTTTVFSGIFFLGARNKSEESFEHGKDYDLHEGEKWLLFLMISTSNLVFFLKTGWTMAGDARHKLRTKYPRFYLCCCLCSNKHLLREEVKQFNASEKNQGKIQLMNEVIAQIQDFRTFYSRNQDFADQKALDELVHLFIKKLEKIQKFKDTSIVSNRVNNFGRFKLRGVSHNESADFINFKQNASMDQEYNCDIEFQEVESPMHLKKEVEVISPREIPVHQRLRGEKPINILPHIITEEFRPESLMKYLDDQEEPECTVQFKQSNSPLKRGRNLQAKVENFEKPKLRNGRNDQINHKDIESSELIKEILSKEVEAQNGHDQEEEKEVSKEEESGRFNEELIKDIKLTSSKGAQQWAQEKKKNGKKNSFAVSPDVPSKRKASVKKIQVLPIEQKPKQGPSSNRI